MLDFSNINNDGAFEDFQDFDFATVSDFFNIDDNEEFLLTTDYPARPPLPTALGRAGYQTHTRPPLPTVDKKVTKGEFLS